MVGCVQFGNYAYLSSKTPLPRSLLKPPSPAGWTFPSLNASMLRASLSIRALGGQLTIRSSASVSQAPLWCLCVGYHSWGFQAYTLSGKTNDNTDFYTLT